MGYSTENIVNGNIGETLANLQEVIANRDEFGGEESYTVKLLQESPEYLFKKINEESMEVILACVEGNHVHIRYEIADLVYHLLVLLRKHKITIEELAGELDARCK